MPRALAKDGSVKPKISSGGLRMRFSRHKGGFGGKSDLTELKQDVGCFPGKG